MIDSTRYTYRYTPQPRVKHIIQRSEFWAPFVVAECGVGYFVTSWRGNRNQAEVDRLATLPVCKTCAKRIGRGRGGSIALHEVPMRDTTHIPR